MSAAKPTMLIGVTVIITSTGASIELKDIPAPEPMCTQTTVPSSEHAFQSGSQWSEWKLGRFSFSGFYVRRARGFEGWKHLETAVVPKIYDPAVADEIIEVTTEESYEMLQRVYDIENLLLSPSSAANIAGALKVASTISEGTIVTILPDNADKYSEVIKKLIKK